LDIIEKLLDKFIQRLVETNDLRENDKIALNLVFNETGDNRFGFPFYKVGSFNGKAIAEKIVKILLK